MPLIKLGVLLLLMIVVLCSFALGVSSLRRRYPALRRYEERRWDPLAALGTLLLVAVMYAGLSYLLPDFPRGWVGLAIVLGAILVNGLLV